MPDLVNDGADMEILIFRFPYALVVEFYEGAVDHVALLVDLQGIAWDHSAAVLVRAALVVVPFMRACRVDPDCYKNQDKTGSLHSCEKCSNLSFSHCLFSLTNVSLTVGFRHRITGPVGLVFVAFNREALFLGVFFTLETFVHRFIDTWTPPFKMLTRYGDAW